MLCPNGVGFADHIPAEKHLRALWEKLPAGVPVVSGLLVSWKQQQICVETKLFGNNNNNNNNKKALTMPFVLGGMCQKFVARVDFATGYHQDQPCPWPSVDLPWKEPETSWVGWSSRQQPATKVLRGDGCQHERSDFCLTKLSNCRTVSSQESSPQPKGQGHWGLRRATAATGAAGASVDGVDFGGLEPEIVSKSQVSTYPGSRFLSWFSNSICMDMYIYLHRCADLVPKVSNGFPLKCDRSWHHDVWNQARRVLSLHLHTWVRAFPARANFLWLGDDFLRHLTT